MNFRKLITYLTMGTAAAMPLAVAQNPTILQGNYISNVFGNSNFVLNPNAQTNIANVTVSSATVTRSTTTPLVATSEFNITTSTSTGYADWSTRTFDAGIKGQNCEARFSYRGFSVGSTTAQILQGANVVAQLTLTASTDPRIASINFPCGDLSAVTKFRLQQATASLTGTNEIGGIYVGLATNMANVAQAEMVGGLTSSSLSSRVVGSASVWTDLTNVSGTVTAIGKATSASTTMSVTFANLPAGEYQVIMNQPFFIFGGSGGHSCRLAILETTSGDRQVIEQSGSTAATASQYVSIQAQTTARFSFTTAGSRTFKVQVNNNGWTTSANGECYTESAWTGGIFVYRFPSSSELVVTPERQNVFGFTSGTNLDYTTKSASYVTPSGFSMDPATGRCENDGTNAACKIATLPAGRYAVQVSAPMFSAGSNGGNQSCYWGISDGIGTDVALGQTVAANATGTFDGISSITRVFSYSSVRTNVIFKLIVKEAGTGGASANCTVATGSSNGRYWQMSVIPLDQPSNSALYVQGPVKAAETGAAISAGYVGQVIEDSFSMSTTCSSSFPRTLSTPIPPGVWLVQFTQDATSGTAGDFGIWSISWTSATAVTDGTPEIWATQGALRTQWSSDIGVIRVTSSLTSYSASCRNTTGNAINTKATFIRLN